MSAVYSASFRIVNYLLLILAFLSVAVTQMLAGGRHLALTLPGLWYSGGGGISELVAQAARSHPR